MIKFILIIEIDREKYLFLKKNLENQKKNFKNSMKITF